MKVRFLVLSFLLFLLVWFAQFFSFFLLFSSSLFAENVKRPPSDPKWNSLMMTFFAYVNHEFCFEEMYCFVFQLLDNTFLTLGAGYMDSPMVFDKIQEQIKAIMDQKPTSFEELYALAEEIIML